jgi:molybdopterin synthase catalytic subunit
MKDEVDARVELTREELLLEEVSRRVERPEAGAIASFLGVVRRSSQGHEVAFLEYSAYEPMARREMKRIVSEVEERWGEAGVRCALSHRLGRLEIGEASVAIAVSSPHRAQAFEACRWCIDEVKARVPIWKKEVARDGFWWVEDPTNPGAHLRAEI